MNESYGEDLASHSDPESGRAHATGLRGNAPIPLTIGLIFQDVTHTMFHPHRLPPAWR